MNKITLCAVWGTIIMAFAIMIYFLYLLVYPFKTIEVLSPPKVIPEGIHRGDEIFVEIHYIKYMDADIKTTRQIECEDGNLVTLTPVERNFPVGEHKIKTNNLALPNKVSDGKCKLVYLVNYKVNPFRNISHRFESISFTVLPDEE